MLLSNYSYINQICGHNHSGITNPVWIISPHSMRGYWGRCESDDSSVCEQRKRDSFPTGTNPPYTIMMGDKGSLLSATTSINNTSSLNGNLAMGINLVSNLSGSGDLTSNLSLLVQLTTSLVGTGSITSANMVGTVALASALIGSGDLTGGLNLLANLNTSLVGVGSLSADLKGTASLQANIFVNSGTATINELVDGVWNALSADFNNTNTMGEIMNNMGAAADPWSTTLPGSYAPGEAGYIMGNLLSNIPDSVWDELKATHTTASSYGKIVQDLETLAKQIKGLTAAQL